MSGTGPDVFTGAMIRRLNDDDSEWVEASRLVAAQKVGKLFGRSLQDTFETATLLGDALRAMVEAFPIPYGDLGPEWKDRIDSKRVARSALEIWDALEGQHSPDDGCAK